MRVVLTERFVGDYVEAPAEIQKLFGKLLAHLLRDLRHPSLRAKKYDDARDIWQARVSQDWRLYFQIVGDSYEILSIRQHPK
jgi:hypothetical protein